MVRTRCCFNRDCQLPTGTHVLEARAGWVESTMACAAWPPRGAGTAVRSPRAGAGPLAAVLPQRSRGEAVRAPVDRCCCSESCRLPIVLRCGGGFRLPSQKLHILCHFFDGPRGMCGFGRRVAFVLQLPPHLRELIATAQAFELLPECQNGSLALRQCCCLHVAFLSLMQLHGVAQHQLQADRSIESLGFFSHA